VDAMSHYDEQREQLNMQNNIKLMQGDCLERMKEIESGSVDMILTDPPYGTTACKWDSIIPLEPMWEQLKRIIKPNGAIVMTASQPFTSVLVSSNLKMFKYEWIWEKDGGSNFATVKYQPMKEHESILVFSKGKTTYNQIKQERIGNRKGKETTTVDSGRSDSVYGTQSGGKKLKVSKLRCPRSIQRFNRERGLHPTQKPVSLMEYLIKTYTNEGETVLDFTCGSGSTGVAAKNLNRDFIGIELDGTYFNIAKDRIENA
jgi:site-specific DNA-methyltransferase (adenine-specific)